VPTFVHNTVDNPIFPNRGRKLTAALDIAGLGGNTNFLKPSVEGIWFIPQTSRTTIGLRASFEYIRPWGSTQQLPIFERLVLGGEYSIRGFDIRSIGPLVPDSVAVLGGNKSLLFNAEYQIAIAGPVRLIFFYDAGQVRDFGESFSWTEPLMQFVPPAVPALTDPFTSSSLIDPGRSNSVTKVVGTTSAFKTSTGAEVRFFMPVLNVPFRLIFAANPQRGNVLDNNYQPAKNFVFKFAVGSTF
jgi:outer membrane protein insertion porin family